MSPFRRREVNVLEIVAEVKDEVVPATLSQTPYFWPIIRTVTPCHNCAILEVISIKINFGGLDYLQIKWASE